METLLLLSSQGGSINAKLYAARSLPLKMDYGLKKRPLKESLEVSRSSSHLMQHLWHNSLRCACLYEWSSIVPEQEVHWLPQLVVSGEVLSVLICTSICMCLSICMSDRGSVCLLYS